MRTAKRRYLAVKIDGIQKIEERELKNVLWTIIARLFGDYGASRTGFVLINYDATKNYAVIRCSNATLNMIRASLASITEIRGEPTTLHLLGVSGTLKSLKTKFPST